eukprot:TRINITY_DN68688_c0_g1_i1.p1 TRINITY_DN68688_c0_g1~~TRINITY_DN68688_c0_g1_i1.p1  ORF type:complete len:488 (-),score=98.18 TRINITY_DN68688_c0_g1_i1:68-1531(-)
MSPVIVYELQDCDLYAVICNNDKEPIFQGAVHLAQEALQLTSLAESVESHEGEYWNTEEHWPPELLTAVKAADCWDSSDASPSWNLFREAKVTSGSHAGVRAIGLGSNQKKLQRSSLLALAVTVLKRSPPTDLSSELQELLDQLEVRVVESQKHPACVPSQERLQIGEGSVSNAKAPPPDSDRAAPAALKREEERAEGYKGATIRKAPPPAPPHSCRNMSSLEATTIRKAPPPGLQARAAAPLPKSAALASSSEGVPAETSLATSTSTTAARWLDGPSVAPAVAPPPKLDPGVAARLSAHTDTDVVTIRTLSSNDTIPLGTDTDPAVYRNTWASTQTDHPIKKLLVECNLGCRVLDAENVGYSYGADVLNKPGFYDSEGVLRCVRYFLKRAIECVVVTKRTELIDELRSLEGVEVIKAERTDDIMVLKQAMVKNCPIVSRDGYAEWRNDIRLARELREWFNKYSELQVRFSWVHGKFEPDSTCRLWR